MWTPKALQAFARRLTQSIEDAGIPLEELSHRSEVPLDDLKDPSRAYFYSPNIALILRVDIEWLMFGEGAAKPARVNIEDPKVFKLYTRAARLAKRIQQLPPKEEEEIISALSLIVKARENSPELGRIVTNTLIMTSKQQAQVLGYTDGIRSTLDK